MTTRTPQRAEVGRAAVMAQLGVRHQSRADLARSLGVSPAHIGQIVRQLIADGLVHELDQQPSRGGRRATRLGLSGGSRRAIGLKIAPDHVALVDVGLDGAVVRSHQVSLDTSSATIVGELVTLLRQFIADSPNSVLGIGVAVPGTVDGQETGVVESYQLGWSQIPLGPALRRDLGVPVLVDNNVTALALAEQLFGRGRGSSDLLLVTLGTGIGSALVVDGAIVRGSRGGAGELGHVPTDPQGMRCTCGNVGCLEMVIGEAALVREAREKGVVGASGGIGDLLDAARQGSRVAQGIYERAGEILAAAIAPIVQIIDPERVIVSGEGSVAWNYWLRGFDPVFRKGLLPARRAISVEVEEWSDARWAQGAACLLLATPFDHNGVAGEQGALVRNRLAEYSAVAAEPSDGR